MNGIVSYGAYIPYYRLKKETAAQAFGKMAGKGEKAVAYCDEDSITMAVAAAMDAMTGIAPASLAGVLFASASAPYQEKMNATEVAAALDTSKKLRTADFSGSLRAGSAAMLAAFDAKEKMLVTMSDCRLGAADGKFESELGDGAAAFLLGSEDVLATLDGTASVSQSAIDQWRSSEDTYVRNWDMRYANVQLYAPLVKQAVTELLAKLGLQAADYSKIVLYGHEEKNRLGLAAKLGFQPEQVQPSMYGMIGNTGNAAAGLMLCAALDTAKAGDKILFVTYGEGCDAMSFTVTEKANTYRPATTVEQALAHKNNTLPYGKYLKWKGMVDCEPQKRPAQDRSALPEYFRNYKKNYNLVGSRCTECGTPVFPPQRVCVHCHSIDKAEPYSFLDKTARVRTFTLDGLSLSLDSPNFLVVIEFEGGGKMMTYLVDCKKEDIEVGMDVDGVALATVISQAVSAILVIIALSRRTDACKFSFQKMRIHRKALASILRIGLPAGIQSSLFSISNVITASALNSFDSAAILSGNGASQSLEIFTDSIGVGFSQAAPNFVAQNLGARQYDRIKKSFVVCLGVAAVFIFIACYIMYLFREPLLGLYITDSAEAISYGTLRMRYLLLLGFLMSTMTISTGGLQGLGYSMTATVITLISACGLRIAWIFTVFQIPEYHTLDCIYAMYPISWIITTAVGTVLFFLLWKKKKRKDSYLCAAP